MDSSKGKINEQTHISNTDNEDNYIIRLEELKEQKGITDEDIATLLHISESTVSSYCNGQRKITVANLSLIAKTYGVSTDWLLGLTDSMNTDDIDIMLSIISVLDKVFKVSSRPAKTANGTVGIPTLQIDHRFYRFLCDIQDLERLKNSKCRTDNDKDCISDEMYSEIRKNIYLKHKEYLKDIFLIDGFNEEKALKIEFAEDISFLDFLTSAFDKTTPKESISKNNISI